MSFTYPCDEALKINFFSNYSHYRLEDRYNLNNIAKSLWNNSSAEERHRIYGDWVDLFTYEPNLAQANICILTYHWPYYVNHNKVAQAWEEVHAARAHGKPLVILSGGDHPANLPFQDILENVILFESAGCLGILIEHLPEPLCYFRVDHGENRLSESDRKTQVIYRANAVVAMNREIIKNQAVIDEVTKNRILKILYYQAMHLFYLDEKKRALELLSEIQKTSYEKITVFSGFVNLFSPFLRSRSLGHVLYKFRKYF